MGKLLHIIRDTVAARVLYLKWKIEKVAIQDELKIFHKLLVYYNAV